MSWPGVIRPGQVSDDLVAAIEADSIELGGSPTKQPTPEAPRWLK